MEKYQGKYRIESARATWWDYTREGDYFITACTKNRKHLFGYVKDDEMILNEYGKIVWDCWYDLPNHYPNIVLDEFQVMPNHFHCIVGVRDVPASAPVETGLRPVSWDSGETGLRPVSTELYDTPIDIISDSNIDSDTARPDCGDQNCDYCKCDVSKTEVEKKHGVFEYIRALKSFSSRKINEARNTIGTCNWQGRFHDHIIRNEDEYNRIKNYIINNPKKWNEDRFYSP